MELGQLDEKTVDKKGINKNRETVVVGYYQKSRCGPFIELQIMAPGPMESRASTNIDALYVPLYERPSYRPKAITGLLETLLTPAILTFTSLLYRGGFLPSIFKV
ncbi:hypothetical protein WA026_013793 [Henosepilachna vigintioctopunctata]|uniref:Uncharacterized protein n=1 Tax=Henosepilachna vigintioctopunctata TaxID=420089 RepID=A0AAW1V0Z0_9CUCU